MVNRRMSRITKPLSLILIPIMVIFSGGCSGYEVMTRLEDHKDKPIRITTKDQTQYELVRWKLLNDRGDIEGTGTKILPRSGFLPLQRSPFQGTVQASTIISLEADTSSPSTVGDLFLGLGIVVGIILLLFLLFPPDIRFGNLGFSRS